jgi:hypothetical protein
MGATYPLSYGRGRGGGVFLGKGLITHNPLKIFQKKFYDFQKSNNQKKIFAPTVF